MACKIIERLFLLAAYTIFVSILTLALLPILSASHVSHHHGFRKENIRGFKISDDMFWKDGRPFQIIGGDLHYFRVLPEYWEDRLLRAKALGLNTIQTYVPWNLHEPSPQKWDFEGIANIESFLKLTQELGFLVMLRAGPYICAEWDLGGFPAWLLAIEPALKLRSSDPVYLHLVRRWWGVVLPKIIPFLYENGGPIIMVQVENEFGSFGDDKTYLRYLATLARGHLGKDIILHDFPSAHAWGITARPKRALTLVETGRDIFRQQPSSIPPPPDRRRSSNYHWIFPPSPTASH